jgi:starch synthase (maltosyl-transferring)
VPEAIALFRGHADAGGIMRSKRPYEQIVVESVTPSVDSGRYPAKAVAGEPCIVEALVFRHGHERLRATVRYRGPGETHPREVPMTLVEPGMDRWRAALPLGTVGRYYFTVAGWTDHYASWVEELRKRVAAAQPDVASEMAEGLAQVERVAQSTRGDDHRQAVALLAALRQTIGDPERLLELAGSADALSLMARVGPREDEGHFEPELTIVADRPRARFGAWYELFVRSQTTDASRPGTFRDAEQRLPALHHMGFDVVYLAPIHPIGHTKRKGPNNKVGAGPGDPGSPWAIGSPAGGHMAVEPALGTLDDFDHFVRAAAALGMDVALDLAIQCSPDHPWVREHPEWFYQRADGTIRYAENPPKKYEDIYPINFDTPDWRNLWDALLEVVRFWVAHGVTIFRVDNPHTKPIGFWTWLIDTVQRESPDVIFLAEAFTRPPMMQALAKRGFTQSYTYFTWRNTKAELTEYLTELIDPAVAASFRPNFFANTPDILPPILQHGGPPAFKMRLVLAAMLSPSYGIYSGYELCEHAALPGREEYLDSEKYEIRPRQWDAAGNLNEFITLINLTRRQNPALHHLTNLRFLDIDNDQMIAFVKTLPDHSNAVIVVVNLDPTQAQYGTVEVPPEAIGVTPGSLYHVDDVLTGQRFAWGATNWVRLDPIAGEPAHVLRVDPGNQDA